jgi:hypothetical protein
VFNKLPEDEEEPEIPEVTPIPEEPNLDIELVEEEIARLQKELEESEEFEKHTVIFFPIPESTPNVSTAPQFFSQHIPHIIFLPPKIFLPTNSH